ncbi:DUF1345 domain-containing protein [Variovorax terrae]|uniref:DUF1345 domain-containing protein n=1 Tax=Variovorax terrae TaxID=2923278 RepID=A0A9X2APQ0_9BURK|nr:DUF1345 domain-containing protein [Variovorax terrae]MCJ0762276.1 DUF1345 domain-containing protein [Variovorax terrae]
MRKHFSETTGPQRLIYGLAVGAATVALPWPLALPTRGLLAWCLGAAVYLVLAWWLAVEFDAERTRHRVRAQDQRALVLFMVMVVAVLASVAAIALMLQQVKGLSGAQRSAHIVLSMLALACSWLLIQAIFAFRYAHRYYRDDPPGRAVGSGLEFPGGQNPDYFDFMYYSHVVGMTSQVSDVQITSREMRRLTLVHSVLAFGFNMLVLALSINVVAGAMQ